MALFRLTPTSIEELSETSFEQQRVRERGDLQRLLKANISVVAPDVLVIAEEFCEWEDSKRRIDLLGIDHDANLVVIELKRDNEGGHMELQALRYAAMVSNMTFDRATEVFRVLLEERGEGGDARLQLLEFLRWDEPREEDFGRDTRIILVAADFLKELTTTVLWLNDCSLDIRCVRMKPYAHGSEIFVDVQQVLPLPEAEEYQVRLREKTIGKRESIRRSGDPTGYWFMNVGDAVEENRCWEDRKKHGFMSAGGRKHHIDAIRRLKTGDQIFAYATGQGFVGFGRITSEAVPYPEFRLPHNGKSLLDVGVTQVPLPDAVHDSTQGEWYVGVDWIAAVDREKAVLQSRAFRGTVGQIWKQDAVDDLLKSFGVEA